MSSVYINDLIADVDPMNYCEPQQCCIETAQRRKSHPAKLLSAIRSLRFDTKGTEG